jgi:putative transcriptional regulator
MLELGSTIKALRKVKGIKQYELAAQLGITGTYLSQVENNLQKPSLDLLKKIGSCTGRTVSEIFIMAIYRTGLYPADLVLAGPTIDIIIEYLSRSHPKEL